GSKMLRATLAEHLEPLTGLMKDPRPDALARELTGPQLVAHGQRLFWTLFGDEGEWRSVMNRVIGAGENPIRRPLRILIRERPWDNGPPLFDALPWRITAWQGRLLARPPVDWRFEVAWVDDDRPRARMIDSPCRIVVIAPKNHEPRFPIDSHVADIRQVVERMAEQSGRSLKSLFTVVRTPEQLREACRPAPTILYYFGHGEVVGDQLFLAFDGDGPATTRMNMTELRNQIVGGDHRYPEVVYLNGCRTSATGIHGAARHLLPDVPVVIGECTTSWTSDVAKAACDWLRRVLVEAECPIDAIHAVDPMTPHQGPVWATTTIATHVDRFDVRRVKPVGRVLVKHSADRAAQRGITLTRMNQLLGDGDTRLQAFIGWGTPVTAPHLLSQQLLAHVREHAHGPPAIRVVKVRIPKDRDDLTKDIAANVHAACGLEDLDEPIEHGLHRLAPQGTFQRRPVIWFDFGVYGLGEADARRFQSGPSTGDASDLAPWEPPLLPDELRAWWTFCCHRLAPACPNHIRLVTTLAIVPQKLKGFREFVDTRFVLDRQLQYERFDATVLPPLGDWPRVELFEFLKARDARCPSEIRFEVGEAIMAECEGKYAHAIELLAEGMETGWSMLLERLRRHQQPSDDDRGDIL
ncbi:MAG: CHAT domain-containing protein, partial [Myxococcota bacterium]